MRNQISLQKRWPFLASILGSFLLLFLAKDHFLFWDTVQFGSAHPNFYFTTNWSSFWLPPSLDSGHPPFFGMYIALWWKIFGKTLTVTHMAMWPIVFGIIWQIWILANRLIPSKAGWILLIAFLEPVLLGQFTLVSPDLVVVFAFLIAINSILKDQKFLLILAIIILGMISTRGMMLAFAIFSWSVIRDGTFKGFWKKLGSFVPGGLIGLAFLIFHYQEFGWIGYHADSSWAGSFERVGWTGLVRNMAIIFVHLLDFGHLFMWLILGWTIFKYKSAIQNDSIFQQLVLLLFCLAFFLLPSLILHKYLFNHRYLLPLFIVLDVLTIYTVLKFWAKPKIGSILAIVLLGLGSFWIYPQPIATSWDGTILHWGYYQSRNKMMNYIEQKQIPLNQVGTAFPNIKSLVLIDLAQTEQAFVKAELNQQDWIFYSNVMNDFTPEELEVLEKEFEVEQEFQSGIVFCKLYQKRK